MLFRDGDKYFRFFFLYGVVQRCIVLADFFCENLFVSNYFCFTVAVDMAGGRNLGGDSRIGNGDVGAYGGALDIPTKTVRMCTMSAPSLWLTAFLTTS